MVLHTWPHGTKSWSTQTKGCHSCPPLAQPQSPMSCGFWAWPKTVWILPLRIKPQTLTRMRSQHLHRGQLPSQHVLPLKHGCGHLEKFLLKEWKSSVWHQSENAATGGSGMVHQVLQHSLENKLHDLLGVPWKQTGLAAELWHPKFQIWDVTTKLPFLPPTAVLVQLHWGREKKTSVLANWKINSGAKEILFPNF